MDSSVVRIEPRLPPPPVNFLEWDGFIRICFSRKNKTLGAIFKQASTLALLHQNYQLCQAISNATVGAKTSLSTASPVPLEMLSVEDDADMTDPRSDEDDMDVDQECAAPLKACLFCQC